MEETHALLVITKSGLLAEFVSGTESYCDEWANEVWEGMAYEPEFSHSVSPVGGGMTVGTRNCDIARLFVWPLGEPLPDYALAAIHDERAAGYVADAWEQTR